MWTKEKVGDTEVIEPNEQLVEVLKSVVAQHDKVLEINAEIVKSLVNPVMFIKEDKEG